MTQVLLIAGVVPAPGVLAETVRQLKAKGAKVFLGGAFDEDRVEGELPLDGLCPLPEDIARATPNRRAMHSLPSQKVWQQIRAARTIRQWARRVDVMVALDAHAVYTIWRFAQRNQLAAAHYGVASALRAIETGALPTASGSSRRVADLLAAPAVGLRSVQRTVRGTPKAAVLLATARPVMRSKLGAKFWETALTTPRIPDEMRVKAAYQVALAMSWAGDPTGEARALSAASRKVRQNHRRATLLHDAALREFNAGIAPRDLNKAIKAQLSLSDYRHGVQMDASAAELMHRALALAFHRVLHIDQLTSPLAKDPEGFVAPFRESVVFNKITTPRGRLRPAAPPPTDRPLRLLIVTSANDNFLGLIRERYEAHPGVEVRYLDLADNAALRGLTWAPKAMIQHRLTDEGAYGQRVEERLRPHYDWADTVFIDWCVAPAALFTLVDPGDTRVIVRLHSYEALARWPYLVDFSRVDDLVFVADHIRDLTTTLVPTLRGDLAPRMHFLDNAMDLRGFAQDKDPDARFQLGMIGINQVAKDPRWSVEVLRRLRKHDERYRMLLVGGDMNPDTSHATRVYLEAFEKDLAELEPIGAIRRMGPTDDVPKALTEIGVILSSSVREGCHCGLMEGAASAAVPVVRDWPFFAGRPHSARTLYPQGWVFDTPEEAAARILEATATEEGWREAGARASEHALTCWDWSVVAPRFDRLILPDDPAGPPIAPAAAAAVPTTP
jgi:hypothetical protein